MRTGLKTFIHTTLKKISRVSDQTFGMFPESALPSLVVRARMRALMMELSQSGIRSNLGLPVTIPHHSAIRAYYDCIALNPGHLGTQKRVENESTGKIEADVIQSMAHLYTVNPDRIRGYITSGGSEGNIFALNLGRQSLATLIPSARIALIVTPLTHYSVLKTARLMNIPVITIPVDHAFGMDVDAFEHAIRTGFKRGYSGYLVALTAGYTETGTSDDIHTLSKRVGKLSRAITGLRFHLALDASFSGLTLPFDSSGFSPFIHPMVQSVVTDFHKFGMVPFSAGVILYRSHLVPKVARSIPYLPQLDTTLLGSRSGIPAVAIWSVMHSLGASGFTRIVELQVRHAELFRSLLAPLRGRVDVIFAPKSLIMGLIVRQKRLPSWVEERYWLQPSRGDSRISIMEARDVLYSIHFMPHVTEKLIRNFVRDLMGVVT